MAMETIDEKLRAINEQIAQQQQAVSVASKSSPPEPALWSTTNAMTMSTAVLVFGLLVICFATYLIRTGQHMESVLRIFGTILIIVIAVFLVVAGYSDQQIAPVMGLLGTIVGYLLGKESGDTKKI